MQTFTEMPYGYRWMTVEEYAEYDEAVQAGGRLWGWMKDEHVGRATDGGVTGLVVQWDCMIEFGMDHDHDAVECEQHMALMNEPIPDMTDYSGWYGCEQGYNDGLRWSDFV